MMKLDPTYPIADLNNKALTTRSENKFDTNTSIKSLIHTPPTKLIPPARPLLTLCLTTVMITGPTDNAKNRPSPIPFIIDSINLNDFQQ